MIQRQDFKLFIMAIILLSSLIEMGCSKKSSDTNTNVDAPAGQTPKDDNNEGSLTTDGTLVENYRIFVSSVEYSGNLGGLAGADAKCQSLASAAGLTRTYKAILSSSSVNAVDRINKSLTGKVIMIQNGGSEIQVASSIAALFDAASLNLQHFINLDEAGLTQTGSAFTGSANDGTKISADSGSFCGDWTNTSDDSYVGSLEDSDGTWLNQSDASCSVGNEKRLFCLSQ